MTADELSNVISKSIIVRRSVDTAFRIWTENISLWWPRGHSISGQPDAEIFIEGRIGGRFYERTPDGVEYVWGQVMVWNPPHRLVYNWYRGSSVEQPTQVDIRFQAHEPGVTRVEVQHYGPDLIGELWWERSAGYQAAWEEVLPCYVAVADGA